MRVNQPVTQNENDFPEHEILMSATNLKGRIVYVNSSFARVCKYLPEEMVGQQHNLIRHPDVPEAAYRDLWANLENDRFWSAMLKNRCKDGDYYWVRANVTPVFRNGRKVGYLSVRIKPDRASVEQAQQLFDEYKQGRPSARFRGGKLIRTGVKGWMDRIRGLGHRAQLWGASVVATATWMAVAAALDWPLNDWLRAVVPLITGLTIVCVVVDTRIIRRIGSMLDDGLQMAVGQKLQPDYPADGDEIALLRQALVQANYNAHSFVSDASQLTIELQYAMQEIASGSRDLSFKAAESSKKIQTTQERIDQLRVLLNENSRDLNAIASLARKADVASDRLGRVANDSAAGIQDMDRAGQQITHIVDMIDSIASQTNCKRSTNPILP